MPVSYTHLLMGEDGGVFGGDFGTSVGMLEEFGPERVRDCPISEAAISGAAAGAAMTGLRPIVDMTFMDFSVIAMDNIVNQAAKTRYMFGGKGQVPMTVRCAAGNGVGSAAQHSQSLESWFTHIPGLKVVAPGTPADMKGLLKSSIRDNNPVIILEYKSEFNQKGEVPVDPDYTIPVSYTHLDVYKRQELSTREKMNIHYSLFLPRGGLSELYYMDANHERMMYVNNQLSYAMDTIGKFLMAD